MATKNSGFRTFRRICVLIILAFFAGGCALPYPVRDSSSSGKVFFDKKPSDSKSVTRIGDSAPDIRVLSAPGADTGETAGPRPGSRRPSSSIRINEFYAQDLPVQIAMEILTELTGSNIMVLQDVMAFPLRGYIMDSSLDQVIDSVCRSNRLWHRTTGGVTVIMSEDSYSDTMVFRKTEKIQAFFMKYTNAADMASLVSTVLGPDVQFRSVSSDVYGHLDGKEAGSSGGGSKSSGAASSAGTSSGTGKEQEIISAEEKKKLIQNEENPETEEASEVTKSLGKKLPALLTVFKKNNCLIVRTADGDLIDEISGIIQELDTPTRQVLIEVKIIKLQLGDKFESFFRLESNPLSGSTGTLGRHTQSLAVGSTASIGAETMTYLFSNDAINAKIAFFAEDNRAEIVSTPFLLAADNAEVKFFAGEEVPLRKDVKTETVPIGDQGDTRTTFTVEVEREELGTDLSVKSFINANGTVTMDMNFKTSTPKIGISNITLINEKTGEPVAFPIDGIDKNEIRSIIAVPSNHTVALGGMIKSEDQDFVQKVPFLGDIPVLGYLFKKVEKKAVRNETVMLVTPHVLSTPSEGMNSSGSFMERESDIRSRKKEQKKSDPPEAGSLRNP